MWLVLSMTSLSLLTEHPLSEDRLKNIFENTRNLYRLCVYLNIPDDKRTVAGAVESYSMSGDPMKGRKMIFWLDEIGDTSLADSVMDCAEPPAGMCMYTWMYMYIQCAYAQMYMYVFVHVLIVLGMTVHDRPQPTTILTCVGPLPVVTSLFESLPLATPIQSQTELFH